MNGINDILDALINAIKDRKDDAKNSVEDLISNALKALTSFSIKSDFKSAGKTLGEKVGEGIESAESTVKNASEAVATSAASATTSEFVKNQFISAGSDLVTGFANGITSRTWYAEAKAKSMAAAAAEAARKELDEHSPSKVGYEIGDFFGVAFVNAIGDYVDKAHTAGSNMANAAKNGLGDAIAKINDIVNFGINDELTIRPVLDLSNVTSGANAINDMFNMRPSVGVMSSVGAISSMMNNNQNGDNEIISAIKDLGRKIGETSGDSYTINGVTYDDGSNISDAVKSIIRAAKVERRI